MRLGASEARIGVSCTGMALQRACSIFLQGLTGRGASCWPPFAVLRCWSLLVAARSHRNAGGREGVGKGALSSEFSSLRTRTVLALSQIRPCNTTPSGQAWSGKPNLHRNNTSSLLGLAVGGRHCLGVAHARFPPTGPEFAMAPGPPHQVMCISPAFKHTYIHTTKEFGSTASALLFELTCSPPVAKETLQAR
jgi:hypothetical protein